jgi:hypothetical protein
MNSLSQVSEFGFRKAKGGMTLDQVNKTESGVKWNTTENITGSVLFFETQISGTDAFAGYYFLEGTF